MDLIQIQLNYTKNRNYFRKGCVKKAKTCSISIKLSKLILLSLYFLESNLGNYKIYEQYLIII